MLITSFEMIFIISLLILFILMVLNIYLLSNSDHWKKLDVFCPDSRLLFGNLPEHIFGKKNITLDIDDLYQKYNNQYNYIGIFNFRKPRWVIFEPEILKDVFNKYFKHFQGNEFTGAIDKKSDPLFGNHPFFLINDEWKDKRAEMAPAFTVARV